MSYYDYKSCEGILQMADAEAGPSCCDDEYCRLRAIMLVAPDLLAALIDARAQLIAYELADSGEDYNSPSINAAIAKARGEA